MPTSNGSFDGQVYKIDGNTGEVTPKNSGGDVVNVYEKLAWKLPGSVDEVPYLEVKAFQLNPAIHLENITRIISGFVGEVTGKEDPYENLYKTDDPKFWFILPYILTSGSDIFGTEQDWKELSLNTKQTLGKIHIPESLKNSERINSIGGRVKSLLNVGQTVVAGAKIITQYSNQGTGSEPVSMYHPSGANSVTISFPLYNTISPSYTDSHFEFVTLFNALCLKRRTSFYTYEFPYIFSVRSWDKGGVYMAKAFCQKFSVRTIGPSKSINNKLIPEAYVVSMTFTELIVNSRNIFAASMGGGTIDGA